MGFKTDLAMKKALPSQGVFQDARGGRAKDDEDKLAMSERMSQWSEWLAAGLHARNRWRLPVLLVGILFASGRRTVTTWLRAAGVSDDFQDYYYFLAAVGRKTKSIAAPLVCERLDCR